MLEPEQRLSNNDLPENNHLRLGLNRWLQIFITQSYYLFLVRPIINGSNNDDSSQSTSTMIHVNQLEQMIREKSLMELVTIYKKLPQKHTPDRPTWYFQYVFFFSPI